MSGKYALLAALAPAVLGQTQPPGDDYNTDANPKLDMRTGGTILTEGFPDCTNGPLHGTKVCNTSVSSWDRAAALIAMFTLEELVNNTDSTDPGVPRLGLPPVQIWNEALHGLDHYPEAMNGSFSWATSFPEPITSMASLNRSLIHQIGDIISTQARAANNFHRYGLDSYAPNINGFRSPVWGRGQETPGEDAYFLSSLYAYEYITSMQGGVIGANDVPKIRTTPKHFAGYDIESWHNHSRLGNDVNITSQWYASYFTPQFRTAVQFAKAKSLMCSYNAVNGIPSCSNSFLLQTLLRDTWGFGDGYVSSDCDAVYNVYNPHQYTANLSGAAAESLRSGCDIDCGTTFSSYLTPALDDGEVTRDDIELALTRFYSGLVQQGYFDGNSSSYRSLTWADTQRTDALNVSYEAAVEGTVLLKNDGTLPLSQNVSSIALIGPWANATTQMQGNYFQTAPYLISPLAAAEASGLTVNYAFGTNISSTNTTGFGAALAAARKSDVIIFAGGIDNTIEAEAMDRENITWPGQQLSLIHQLSQVGKPLVVLQMGGGQVDSSSLKNNSNVNSLIWGGYPGQSGGQALMDIIRGVRAPAGRLISTQYPAEYVNQFDQLDMNLAPHGDCPGQTYMYYTGEAVYPFGHGLFYTTFQEKSQMSSMNQTYNISAVNAAPHTGYAYIDEVPVLNFTFTLTNTGEVDSDYTAMLFASTTSGPTPRPIKWLVGVDREANVEANGGSCTVTIPVPLAALARADSNGDLIVYPGSYQLALNNEKSVTYNFELTGSEVPIQKWPESEANILL